MACLAMAEARLHSGYALFRVESGHQSVWCTSKCLEFLDAKDSLYAALVAGGAANAMPPTLILDWDCAQSRAADIDEFIAGQQGVVILKAALGAGGFGLYLVTTAQDCLSVIIAHASKARDVEGFLDKLKRDYAGTVPCWSLQARLSPVRVSQRKSQARVYVIFLECAGVAGGQLFLYETVEIRLPVWCVEDPGAQPTQSDDLVQYEQAICAGSDARAYNTGRVKRDTERLLLSECPELQGAQEIVLACLVRALGALGGVILTRCLQQQTAASADTSQAAKCPPYHRMAVVGADVLISRDASGALQAHILEFNNNPAIPDPEKHKMSVLYRQHLVEYCRGQITLGLSGGKSRKGFRYVHF